MTHVSDMDDDAYVAEIGRVEREESVEAALALALRESRYVMSWFPPYSSGAGDMIEAWLRGLWVQWGLAASPAHTVDCEPGKGPDYCVGHQ